MKNTSIILSFVSLFTAISLYANVPPTNHISFKEMLSTLELEEDCDVCGCTSSGGGFGFFSAANDHFVGIRYIYQDFRTREGLFRNDPWSNENFNTIQIWSRIKITDKIFALAVIPYHFHERIKSTGTESISGIGDITINGFYEVVNYGFSKGVIKSHAGLGVKLPTGKFDSRLSESVNPSFQVGTGSWDGILSHESTFITHSGKWGANVQNFYTIKGENQNNYRFGNQSLSVLTLFYNKAFKNAVLIPQLGLAYENYASNKEFGERVPNTYGEITLLKSALEYKFSSFVLGAQWLAPVSQNVMNGNVRAKNRIGFHINYVL